MKKNFLNGGYEIVVYCLKIHLEPEPEPPKIERLRNTDRQIVCCSGLPAVDVNSSVRSNSVRRKRKHSPDDVAAANNQVDSFPVPRETDISGFSEM